MKLKAILSPIEALHEISDSSTGSGFSLKTLKSFKTPPDKIDYAQRCGLKFVGEGSSRMVFDLGNNKVIKIAKDIKGIEQNAVEAQMSGFDSDIVVQIFGYDDKMSYLICEKAIDVNPTRSKFEAITGVDRTEAFEFIHDWSTAYMRTEDGPNREVTKSKLRKRWWQKPNVTSNPWVRDILHLMKEFDLRSGDLKGNNLGVVIRNNEYFVVVIDAGFNNQVHKEHYDWSVKPQQKKKYDTGYGETKVTENKTTDDALLRRLTGFSKAGEINYFMNSLHGEGIVGYLGQGTSRVVYSWGQTRAIKIIANDEDGPYQNAVEAKMANSGYDCVPHVLYHDSKYKFLVVERAYPVSMSLLYKFTSFSNEYELIDYLDEYTIIIKNERLGANMDTPERIKKAKRLIADRVDLNKYPFVAELLDMIKHYGFLPRDIRNANLGYVEREGRKQLVILDPGLNE